MTGETHVFHETHTTCDQVNWCSYSRWSPFFGDYTPEAHIIASVPSTFLDYLNSESIRLPPPKYDPITMTSDNEYSDWEDEKDDSDWEDENDDSDPCASFQNFHQEVSKVVDRFGSVLVKLNWSAPKDARWLLINNSLRCTSASDIYLLLNASDHAAHDLDGHIYDECDDKDDGVKLETEVVLKKWIPELNPALEFRVFVRNRKVLGVSQRDINHYEFLTQVLPKVHLLMQNFQHDVLATSSFPLRDYIIDIYVPRPYDKVVVIDINPFNRKWDSILFTWHELLEKDNTGEFEVRLISEANIGRMSRVEHSENQVPIEVVDALMNSDTMIELAKNWNSLQNASKNNDL